MERRAMMMNPKAATETVLVVSPLLNLTAALSGILEGGCSPLTVLYSSDCEQALARLTDSKISVVICETHLPDGSWRDLLAYLELVRASAALVVTSQIADEFLWAE